MDGGLGLWVVYRACAQLLTLPDRLKRQFGAVSKRFPDCDDRVLTAGFAGLCFVETFTFRTRPEEPLSLGQPMWPIAHLVHCALLGRWQTYSSGRAVWMSFSCLAECSPHSGAVSPGHCVP